MIRMGWLAALCLALTSTPCPGQGGEMGRLAPAAEEWTVKVEMFSGQTVTGKLTVASVWIASELGEYEIRPEKIKAIELAQQGQVIQTPSGTDREGALVTASGEKISGTVRVSEWTIETDLGRLTPYPANLKTLTFVARIKPEPKKPRDPVDPTR